MRRAVFTAGLAVCWIVVGASAALAGAGGGDATYPPPTHMHRVPPVPGVPTAFTGSDLSKPLVWLGVLVVVGVLAVLASLAFTHKGEGS